EAAGTAELAWAAEVARTRAGRGSVPTVAAARLLPALLGVLLPIRVPGAWTVCHDALPECRLDGAAELVRADCLALGYRSHQGGKTAVYARKTGACTAVSPGGEPGQPTADDQRSAAIEQAGVGLRRSRAGHVVRVERGAVRLAAHGVAHQRDRRRLQ